MAAGARCMGLGRPARARLSAQPRTDPRSPPSGSRSTGPAGRSRLNEDFRDLLAALEQAGARYLVVGAHALAVHGVPRATGDLDVWVQPEAGNAERVFQALIRFGAPVEAMKVKTDDFAQLGMVYQIGLPPRRIDILTEISGVDFDEAWSSHVTQLLAGVEIPFLGREALLRNKRASGRAKDLSDVALLERQGSI